MNNDELRRLNNPWMAPDLPVLPDYALGTMMLTENGWEPYKAPKITEPYWGEMEEWPRFKDKTAPLD